MLAVLIIIAIVLILISFSLHKSADEHERKFDQRPSVILSPSRDLFKNQKYAIVNFLGFVLGTNAVSAYDERSNMIFEHWMSKLELSKKDAENSMRVSMSFSPERSIQIMRDSLCEIKDKNFVRSVFNDARTIAEVSGNGDIINFIDNFLEEVLHS